MSKKWEINRVSTPERIFEKINNEMAQPVGIVLFGADCELKDDVFEECREQIHNLATPGRDGSSHSVVFEMTERGFFGGRNVLLVMSGESSGDHERRHQMITGLKSKGMKSMVGIYAKASRVPIRPLMFRLEKVEFNKQIATIEQNSPTTDGLDYLLVVSEEKEG